MLGRFLLFMLLTLAVGAGLNGLMARELRDHISRKYEHMFSDDVREEGIILGTSVEAHGVDPALLDGRWFNYAVNGSGPSYWRAWYGLYRGAGHRPRFALVAADWFTCCQLGRALEQDAYAMPCAVRWRLLWSPGRSPGLVAANTLALTVGRSRLQERWGHRLGPPGFDYVLEHYHDGFVPLAYAPKNGLGPAFGDQLDERAVADMRGLLADLAADGVKVILLRLPELQPVTGNHAAIARALVERAGATNLLALDYTRSALCHDERAFTDWCHLSEDGSQRFSRQLAADLRVYRPAPGG